MKRLTLLCLIALVFCSLSANQVSGTQSGEWTAANNPYQVVGDITVPAGLTLGLASGVIVQAMGNYSITAQGNIYAVGTLTDSIKFISGQSDPSALWKGIKLLSTTVQSDFQYCRIESAEYGITSVNSPAIITYCSFDNNQTGIQVSAVGITSPVFVNINHNLVEHSLQSGILVIQNRLANITFNDICYNGISDLDVGAIQVTNLTLTGTSNPHIGNNHIYNNHHQGIKVVGVIVNNTFPIVYPYIQSNLIENNYTGIEIQNASGTVRENTIVNNIIPGQLDSGTGVWVFGNSHPYFAYNIVSGNYTGFLLTNNAEPTLGDLANESSYAGGNNQIVNNVGTDNIIRSVVCSNYTLSNITIKAENNDWGFVLAPQIDETIIDYNEDNTLPTIDYAPWIGMVIPHSIIGNVIDPIHPGYTATIRLISVRTGNVLDEWHKLTNNPFQYTVTYDSLVYAVAFIPGENTSGAYGGTDNPTPIHVPLDTQFDLGNIIMTSPSPDWYYKRFSAPININGHISYPLKYGWFVYAPEYTYFLFRQGDFLKLSRVEAIIDSVYYGFNLDNPPIWMKIANLDSDEIWDQYTGVDMLSQSVTTDITHANAGITTFVHGQAGTYDMIDLGDDNQIQILDNYNNNWYQGIYFLHGLMDIYKLSPVLVEPDGTLFPMVEGNFWKSFYDIGDTEPAYFGYKLADSLSFYWLAGMGGQGGIYRIYDNGSLLTSVPATQHHFTISIPTDNADHVYTLSYRYGVNGSDHFCESSIPLSFTHNQDEVTLPQPMSVYPNPFNPTLSPLTVKYGLSNIASAKLNVYNLKGQLVWKAELDSKATSMNWNGKDSSGHICASGLYRMQLIDSKGHKTNKKLMLIH